MTRDDLLRRGWEFRANYGTFEDRAGVKAGFLVAIYWNGHCFCQTPEFAPTLALAEKAALAAFAALTGAQ